MPLFGTDISTYQRTINYKAARTAGIRFAMIKATQGHSLTQNAYLFEDPMFKRHIEGCHEAGIAVGAYHFFTASDLDDTYREADFFINTVMPYKKMISLYLACDAENYGNPYLTKLSRAGLTSLVNAFCHRVEAAGFHACHYTNTDHIKNYIDISKISFPVWQAHYIQNGETKRPDHAGDKLAIHQYTADGQIPGVVGTYDLNFGYAPAARLILAHRTGIMDVTLDYIARFESGDDILMKLADKVAAQELNPLKNPSHEKLTALLRMHCGLSNEQTAYLDAYRWNVDLFRKLYVSMLSR